MKTLTNSRKSGCNILDVRKVIVVLIYILRENSEFKSFIIAFTAGPGSFSVPGELNVRSSVSSLFKSRLQTMFPWRRSAVRREYTKVL